MLCGVRGTSAFPTYSLIQRIQTAPWVMRTIKRVAPEIKIKSLKKKIALPLGSRRGLSGASGVGHRMVGAALNLAASELYLALLSRC